MRQVVFSLILVLSLVDSPAAFGQSANLIEEAKKEGGKVIAYGSLESEAFDAIKAAFQKENPTGTRILARFRHKGHG